MNIEDVLPNESDRAELVRWAADHDPDAIQTDWYCPSCKEHLDGSRVTFEENCDTCGHSVHCWEPHNYLADLNAAQRVVRWAIGDPYADKGADLMRHIKLNTMLSLILPEPEACNVTPYQVATAPAWAILLAAKRATEGE